MFVQMQARADDLIVSFRHSANALARSPIGLGAVATLLMIPVITFTAAGFQFALTLLLAPVAGLTLLDAPAFLRHLFLACLVAGIISLALAPLLLEDSLQPRHVFSLLLIMTSPLYFFLGRHLGRQVRSTRLLEVLATIASAFVLILALDVVVTRSQVRGYDIKRVIVLNLDFLGLPLYGSSGVLSLSSLVVLQAFVIAAAFIAASARWRQAILLPGFAAAVFLILGSNARAPQLVLPCLLLVLGIAARVYPHAARTRATVLIAAGIASVVYSSARMIEPNRLIGTVRALAVGDMPVHPPSTETPRAPVRPRDTETARDPLGNEKAQHAGPSEPAGNGTGASSGPEPRHPRTVAAPPSLDLNRLSSSRIEIWRDSFREVAASPIVGNGFGSFGRVVREVGPWYELTGIRTPHLHYLTIVWKGGVLFFVPYMALLTVFWLRAARAIRLRPRPEALIVCAGVVSLFTILSFTWDILLVPSAGALGFFLLGALSESWADTFEQPPDQ